MQRIVTLTYMLFTLMMPAFSQQAEITGNIIHTGNQPVEYANVQLLNGDSVFIKGTVSDKEGKFKLEATPLNSYLVLISALGYDPVQITLNQIKKRVSLENIRLEEASVDLEEVTVSGSRVIQKIDRQITYPGRIALETSNNALELLNKMALPGVIVNTSQKTVSLVGNESARLRINNVDANPNQVAALQAKDIIRVDYYDNPGVKVQESAIIDFIVKRRDSGGYVSTDLTNAPYMGYGKDLISTKINYKNSEWSLFYDLGFESYKKRVTNSTTDFFFPDYTIKQQTVGIPSSFNTNDHLLNLSYNYTITGKRVIQVTLSGKFFNNRGNDNATNYYSDAPEREFPSQLETRGKNKNPVLDLYYKEELSKNQTLFFNLVTGYIRTNYLRNNREWSDDGSGESVFKIHSTGKKYSVIGEGAHEIRWKKLSLYSGATLKLSYTRNKYEGDNNDHTSLNNSDLYLYSQLQGKTGKLSYRAGIGLSYSYFSEKEKGFRFWTFRPNVSLGYSLTKNINFRYTFEIGQRNPNLSDLSDVVQNIDRFTAFVGDPDLKPYRTYVNRIKLNYQVKKFWCFLAAIHQYYPKAILSLFYYDPQISKFIQTTSNQKHMQGSSILAGLNWEIISDRLSLNVNGEILWMDSKGDHYQHKYTSYSGFGQMNFNLKNWRAYVEVHSRYNTLWGETINYGDWWSVAEVGYKYKELYLGVQANNFLTDKWSSGSKNLSQLAPGTSWTYIYDAAPYICLKLNWNFSWGKQSKAEQKKLINSDSESGIKKIQ